MTEADVLELWQTAVAVIIGPYVIGAPIAIVWVAAAHAVRWLTGWRGLLPADVWNETQ